MGGRWGIFSAAGDRYMSLMPRDLGTAGRALEVVGSFPMVPEGTYGGAFCELSPGKATTVDLTPYTHLVFEATALRPAPMGFAVRLENPEDQWKVPLRTFVAGAAPSTVYVPLAGLPALDRANALVFTSANPRPGDAFGLRLDNVRFERVDPTTSNKVAYYTDFTRALQAHRSSGKPLMCFVYKKGVGRSDAVLEALVENPDLKDKVAARVVLLLVDAERSPELVEQLKIIRLPSLVTVAKPGARYDVVFVGDGLVTVLEVIHKLMSSQPPSGNVSPATTSLTP